MLKSAWYQVLKNFMNPLEIFKKHWVAKVGVFHQMFCLRMLIGKTTSCNYSLAAVLEFSHSVAVFELNRTNWQDFITFLWFILFVIYFARGYVFGGLFHLFELKQRKIITEPYICLQNVWHRPLLNATLQPIDQAS